MALDDVLAADHGADALGGDAGGASAGVSPRDDDGLVDIEGRSAGALLEQSVAGAACAALIGEGLEVEDVVLGQGVDDARVAEEADDAVAGLVAMGVDAHGSAAVGVSWVEDGEEVVLAHEWGG